MDLKKSPLTVYDADRLYLSFNSIIMSCCDEDFLQMFFNHLLIETLLEGHSNKAIQETLGKGKKYKLCFL